MVYTIWIGFLLTMLCFVQGCSGWSVAGWELSPSDSSDSMIYIIDQDSLKHSFRNPVIFEHDNWCYRHNLYEHISKNVK